MAGMPDGSVDAVITDPPYGTTACKWDSVIPFAPMWEAVKRVAKPRAAIVLFASQPFTSALVMSNPTMYRHEWVWEKDKAANILNANRQPLKIKEDIIVFSSEQPVYNPQKAACPPYRHKNRSHLLGASFSGHRSGYDSDAYTVYTTTHPKNIIRFAKPGGSESMHPTQKPVALMEYLIRTYTNEGETVLDFCAGSGSTGVACVNTGRHFIGIEKEHEYVEIARRRLTDAVATQQPALFAAD
jgi:site-specific DNA-methyltransferase (adenine-specific)